jgi:hypothetical protein
VVEQKLHDPSPPERIQRGQVSMRYGVALGIACLIILFGAIFVWQTERHLNSLFRRALQQAKAQGNLPAGVDPKTAHYRDFGIDLPAGEKLMVKITHLFVRRKAILIPVVVFVSLVIAWVTKPKRP